MTQGLANGRARGASGHLSYRTLQVLVCNGKGRLTTMQELVAIETDTELPPVDHSGEEPRMREPAPSRADPLRFLCRGWPGSRVQCADFQQME